MSVETDACHDPNLITGNWWSVAVYSDAAGNTTTTAPSGPVNR